MKNRYAVTAYRNSLYYFLKLIKAVNKIFYLLNISLSAFAGKNFTF